MFYNIADKLLTYHEFYKIAIGQRGRGKTTSAITESIKNYVRGGGKFLYVRRYKSEHDQVHSILKNAITLNSKRNNPWWKTDSKLEVTGSPKKGNGQFLFNGQVMGQWLTLSMVSTYKSWVFDDYTTIIFDEFIIKKGTHRYLDFDVEDLEDLVETVFRHNDNPRIRGVIMLSNKITWYNPYFIKWGIRPFKGQIYRDKERSIVVEQDYSQEFADMKYSTRFGKHLKNTAYGNYSIGNEALIDVSQFIEKRSKNAKPYFNIKYMGKTLGVWLDSNENKLYISENFDPYLKLEFALTTSDHTLNTFYIKNKRNCLLNTIIDFYEQGRLFSDTQNVDSVTQEILKLLI